MKNTVVFMILGFLVTCLISFGGIYLLSWLLAIGLNALNIIDFTGNVFWLAVVISVIAFLLGFSKRA